MPETAVAGTAHDADTRPVAAVDQAGRGVGQAGGLVCGSDADGVTVAILRAPMPP